MQDESNDSKNELVALRKFVANEANEDTFAMLKKRTEKAVLELLSEVQTCTAFDTESLKYTLKQVNATRSTLVSLRKNNTPTLTISLKCNEPLNKNIKKQRRFYFPKKKRKEKNVRLARLTRDEKDGLFRSGYEWLDKLEHLEGYPKRFTISVDG